MAAAGRSPELTSAWVKGRAEELGFDLCGVAQAAPPLTWDVYSSWVADGMHGPMGYLAASLELRRSLDAILPGARSVVAVALNYNQPPPSGDGAPRIARYALGRDYHKVLRGRLARLGRELDLELGTASRAVVDSAPLLEREWAQRAGIGWFGKNTLIINSWRGSWFVLGFLLTTAELDPDAPAEGGCGSCRLCIDRCPTGAIVRHRGRWMVDARQCISTWTIEHKGDFPPGIAAMIGDWTFGCDECQEACPFNQPRDGQPLRARTTTEADFLEARDWPSLEELAEINEPAWDALTRGSPVRRAGWHGLRRNAAANLRNSQTG